jgi:hypothetical protein
MASNDGVLAPIEGAKVAFKSGAKNTTFEITLPTKALPRLTQAPLVALRVVASVATAPKPPVIEAGKWIDLDLADPVNFEPLGELRAKAIEDVNQRGFVGPMGLSYHPADPTHIESIVYAGEHLDMSSVKFAEEVLYEKQATLNDIEVGYVSAYGNWVAILKHGKFMDLVTIGERRRGVFERDGEIHVLTYSEWTETDIWAEGAAWAVVAIAADGSHREDVVQREIANFPWSEVEEFHDKDLRTFGLRGSTSFRPDGKEAGIEITWSWDKRSKTYIGKRRAIPIPKKAKKR